MHSNERRAKADDSRLANFRAAADVAESLDVPHWELDFGKPCQPGRWWEAAPDGQAATRPRDRLRRQHRATKPWLPTRRSGPTVARSCVQRGSAPADPLAPQRHGSGDPRLSRSIHADLGRTHPIGAVNARAEPCRLRYAAAVAKAAVAFVQGVCTGFSDSQFATRLRDEVARGCSKPARGKPALIQSLARRILEQPNHAGVGAFLQYLQRATKFQIEFASVHIDHPREFWDAVRLGAAKDPQAGLAEQSCHNAHTRRLPPCAP